MSTVPEITELNLPRERGYMTIEDDGDTIKAIIRPDLAGAVATDRLRWLRASVVAAGEYLGKLCDKGQPAQPAATWSPRIAVLEKIAGALGYRIEIMPGLDVAGRCHYHRRLIEIGEPDARYAFSVIAHELGHALHDCLVEDVETARTKEQREACATAFASAIGMMAGCEHGRGAECNLAHAPTAESMGAVLKKIADVKKADGAAIVPSLPPWRVELERLRGMVRERQCLAGEELQRLTKLEELDALRLAKDAGGPVTLPKWLLDAEPDFSHFTHGVFRLVGKEWTERTGIITQRIQPMELDELIDAAGAAVLAGEG